MTVTELVEIESDMHYKPALRTTYQLANYFSMPRSGFMQVAGLTARKDAHLSDEAVRFAARAEPTAELTPEEERGFGSVRCRSSASRNSGMETHFGQKLHNSLPRQPTTLTGASSVYCGESTIPSHRSVWRMCASCCSLIVNSTLPITQASQRRSSVGCVLPVSKCTGGRRYSVMRSRNFLSKPSIFRTASEFCWTRRYLSLSTAGTRRTKSDTVSSLGIMTSCSGTIGSRSPKIAKSM